MPSTGIRTYKSDHMKKSLDVICLGRVAVDLYGDQIGGRLEDMQSFAKYLGGSSGNLAAGLARLGTKSSMLARVGNEQMGRFVREALAREGTDVSHVITDPTRLTALVILGIANRNSFPHIFYRENCADMAIEPGDFDEDYIASSRALAITGTHLSTENTFAAVDKALTLARANDTKTILDIDYRPVLWGLVAPEGGEVEMWVQPVDSEEIVMLPGHEVAGEGLDVPNFEWTNIVLTHTASGTTVTPTSDAIIEVLYGPRFSGDTLGFVGTTGNARTAGFDGAGTFRTLQQDKGHRAEIEAFARATSEGGPAPIPWDDLRAVSAASILAVRSLREGLPLEIR